MTIIRSASIIAILMIFSIGCAHSHRSSEQQLAETRSRIKQQEKQQMERNAVMRRQIAKRKSEQSKLTSEQRERRNIELLEYEKQQIQRNAAMRQRLNPDQSKLSPEQQECKDNALRTNGESPNGQAGNQL